MRTKLRVAAWLLALVVMAFWFFGGADRGWTKTLVPRKIKDPVTELEGVVYEKQFVPGLDFLGAGLLAVGGLWGASFLFRTKN